MQSLEDKNISHLGRESLRDPSYLLTPAESSNIPGQVLLMLTASRIYRRTSPDAPTRDFIGKPTYDMAIKHEKGE